MLQGQPLCKATGFRFGLVDLEFILNHAFEKKDLAQCQGAQGREIALVCVDLV